MQLAEYLDIAYERILSEVNKLTNYTSQIENSFAETPFDVVQNPLKENDFDFGIQAKLRSLQF